MYPKLYAITDNKYFKNEKDLEKAVFLCLEYNVDIFQYRFKNKSLDQVLKDFELISNLLYRENGNLLIILNDYKEYLKHIKNEGFYIHGLHLGQDDFDLKKDLKLLNFLKENKLIFGLSTHNYKEVNNALKVWKDYYLSYIGFGPIYKPISKKDHDPVVGIEKLKDILSKVPLPVVAIGGITLENIYSVIETFRSYREKRYDLDSLAAISLFFKGNFEENFRKLKKFLINS